MRLRGAAGSTDGEPSCGSSGLVWAPMPAWTVGSVANLADGRTSRRTGQCAACPVCRHGACTRSAGWAGAPGCLRAVERIGSQPTRSVGRPRGRLWNERENFGDGLPVRDVRRVLPAAGGAVHLDRAAGDVRGRARLGARRTHRDHLPAVHDADLRAAVDAGRAVRLGLAVGLPRVPDRPRRADLVRVREPRTRRWLLQRRQAPARFRGSGAGACP